MASKNALYCQSCRVQLGNHGEYKQHINSWRHIVKAELRGGKADKCEKMLFVRGLAGIREPTSTLASHFQQYGDVVQVSLCCKQGDQYAAAIVHFSNGDSARKASTVVHKLQNHTLEVFSPQQSQTKQKKPKQEVSEDDLNQLVEMFNRIRQLVNAAANVSKQIEILGGFMELTSADHMPRSQICKELNELFASNKLGSVYPFGSSVSGFGMKGCDLDLFLDIGPAAAILIREDKGGYNRLISKISKTIRHSQNFVNVVVIPCQRCPIIRFEHAASKIKVDLSVNNRKALNNTYLLRLYSRNPRIYNLVCTVRLWARFHGLTGQTHLFNSYAITLMVLYFLMHTTPRMIPLVCEIPSCVEGVNAAEVHDNWECLIIPRDAALPASQNFASEGELLVAFFNFCNTINWDEEALVMKNASKIPRNQLPDGCQPGFLTVLDPFVLNHNVAGNVNLKTKLLFQEKLKKAAALASAWPAYFNTAGSPPWGIAELFIDTPRTTPVPQVLQLPDPSNNNHLIAHNAPTSIPDDLFSMTLKPFPPHLKSNRIQQAVLLNNSTPEDQWFQQVHNVVLQILQEALFMDVKHVPLTASPHGDQNNPAAAANGGQPADSSGGLKRDSAAAQLDSTGASSISAGFSQTSGSPSDVTSSINPAKRLCPHSTGAFQVATSGNSGAVAGAQGSSQDAGADGIKDVLGTLAQISVSQLVQMGLLTLPVNLGASTATNGGDTVQTNIYFCTSHCVLWVDRNNMYKQVPKGPTHIALEKSVSELILERQQQLAVASLGQLNPANQTTAESKKTKKKTKQVESPAMQFMCQIVVQNGVNGPSLMVRMKPKEDCLKPFKVFFPFFSRLLTRIINSFYQ